MLGLIFPLVLILCAIYALIVSSSEKNYRKLVQDNGEVFANKVTKATKVCAYLLLVCSMISLVFNMI